MLKFLGLLSICYVLAAFYGKAAGQEGYCYKPFSQFLVCMKDEAQERMSKFMLENTKSVQGKVRACFEQADCSAPNFRKATLNQLLPSPWSHRVHLLIDLLEKSQPDVQSCMIDYFVDQAGLQIQSCINKYGQGDAEYFQLPKLPKLKGLKIGALKQSVLDRIVVTESSILCADQTPSDDDLQRTLSCIKSARSESTSSVCNKRDTCRLKEIDGTGCRNAFGSVETAACACFTAEKQKLISGKFNDFKRIINLFLRGGMTNRYEACCVKYGVPVPWFKLEQVKESIRASTSDTILSGMPRRVQQITAQLVMQISEEVQKILCGGCSGSGSVSGSRSGSASISESGSSDRNRDARQMRQMARARSSSGNSGAGGTGGDVMSGGIRGLFDMIVQGR